MLQFKLIKEFFIHCINMQKEQIKHQLSFKQYPSIELSTRDKFIAKIKQEGHDKPEILWVASQKIHGSNFSVHFDGRNKIARYGRRTDFLSTQIPVPCENPGEHFTQSFYDARNTIKKFHNHLDHVFNKIRQVYPQTQIIQIYGEFFGGLWPEKHQDYVKGPKGVQKGIYYTPNHQFMVFDIKITTSTSVFWVDVLDIPQFLDGKLMHVPVFAKENFEQIEKIDTIIDSTIPQLLGLHKLDKNIIEGMVLRPNTSVSNSYGERVILKKKNEQFLQKASAPKQGNVKQKKQKAVDPEIVPFLDKLSAYLNVNRIESVTSKFPDLKDRNKLKLETLKDIFSDVEKDQFKWAQSEQLNKKIKTQFDKLVIKQINSYFIKH